MNEEKLEFPVPVEAIVALSEALQRGDSNEVAILACLNAWPGITEFTSSDGEPALKLPVGA